MGSAIVRLISLLMMIRFSLLLCSVVWIIKFLCGQKFSAIVLLGDFNAHYNFSDSCLPSANIGVRLFNF